MRQPIAVFILVGLSLTAPHVARGERPARFAAMLADGARIDGEKLSDWHATNAAPKLDGRELLDANNPLRWLRDRSLLPAGAPAAFVETIGGDRLPGVAVGYQGEATSLYDLLPSHLVVAVSTPLKPPQTLPPQHIRVVERFVRRVVWQRREQDRYQPGTLFYRDGRSVTFRAARFADSYVNLLMSDGYRKAFFNEIAELHLPTENAWETYFDELAILTPDGQSRLLQLETTDGLIVTGSLARFEAMTSGNPADFSRWVHGLQPAWSLDILWVPNGDVWVRRTFAPHEVPLTRLLPAEHRKSALLGGGGWPWRLNRNVHGGPLRNATDDFGWGFGVHAYSELHIPLHDAVRAFHSHVGLDRAAGQGGCIRARIFIDSTDSTPLYESPFLIGADNTAETGTIALKGPAGGQQQLILQIDAAHDNRPAGADPLDIRDVADWFDPRLELDPQWVQAEIARRVPKQLAAWRVWNLSVDDGATIQWKTFRDDLAAPPGSFDVGPIAQGKPFSLTKEFRLSRTDNWLVVAASRPIDGGNRPQVEVLIDGQPVAKYEVPLRNRSTPNAAPLMVSLADFHAAQVSEIKVEIRQLSGPGVLPVAWRAIGISEQLPTLYQLLDDQGTFVDASLPGDPPTTGTATMFDDDHHSGLRCAKITADGRFRLADSNLIRIREQPGWGEYRYLRFAFRKFGEGRVCVELNHTQQHDKPVRYDAGLGDPCYGAATRVWLQKLPNQWIVMSRDLYAEFGALDVTGLTLGVPDGEYALFDHIYLARTPADFDSIPAPRSPEVTNQQARSELAKPILKQVRPATVAIETGDGRVGTGVIISADGQVLTAGHFAAGPNRDAIVHLADGRSLKATTLGIARDFDLGLMKINSTRPLPFVEINTQGDLPVGGLYVGVAHTATLRKEGPSPPAAYIVGIRRLFREMIWTDFDIEQWTAGGPLVDKDGKLVGIHTRRSDFGGFLYSRLDELPALLPRLQKGEVWGTWSPGTGPVFGVVVQSTRDGCLITAVTPNGPADKAGLQPNDIIRKVAGRSVVSLEDIYALLADKDPGQEVAVEYFRGVQRDENPVVKLHLAPRTP
jgi:S1-C subfamily serine protease